MATHKPSARKTTCRNDFKEVSLERVNLGDEVRIEWVDATNYNRWTEACETTMTLSQIVSSGVVVGKSCDRIAQASDMDLSNGNIARAHAIPIGCIRKIYLIQRAVASPGYYLKENKGGKEGV